MSKTLEWGLTFKQRIWLEWMRVNNRDFLLKNGTYDMVEYVLMKGAYDRTQKEKLNKMRKEYKKIK